MTQTLLTLALVLAVAGLSGCLSVPPRTVLVDRVDYVQELSESWKRQMLLNTVKLRYFDPPTFLEVSSIINQFGVERQVQAGLDLSWPLSAAGGRGTKLSGQTRFSDQPTISYAPISGQKFIRSLLNPLPPAAVLSLVAQEGWSIDTVFPLTVKSINGIENDRKLQQGDGFARLLQTLTRIEAAGGSDFRPEPVEGGEAVILHLSPLEAGSNLAGDLAEIRAMLRLKPDRNDFRLISGLRPSTDGEIAIRTRSMLDMMLEIAAGIDVPAEHVAQGRVKASEPAVRPLVRIRSGTKPPAEAFAAVEYRKLWYWIDEGDLLSKRNFSLLLLFQSFTELEPKGGGPLLTIGT